MSSVCGEYQLKGLKAHFKSTELYSGKGKGNLRQKETARKLTDFFKLNK